MTNFAKVIPLDYLPIDYSPAVFDSLGVGSALFSTVQDTRGQQVSADGGSTAVSH